MNMPIMNTVASIKLRTFSRSNTTFLLFGYVVVLGGVGVARHWAIASSAVAA